MLQAVGIKLSTKIKKDKSVVSFPNLNKFTNDNKALRKPSNQKSNTQQLPNLNKIGRKSIKVTSRINKNTASRNPQNALPLVAKTVSEQALELLETPIETGNNAFGNVVIKFNHYKKSFPIHNGVLKWKDVDEEYNFSFVYKGNYRRDIFMIASSESAITSLDAPSHKEYFMKDELSNYFLGLRVDIQYMIEVEEDPIAGLNPELNIRNEPLRLTKESCDISRVSNGVKALTNELKAMKVTNLQSSEARDILERRELEDILYGNS